MTRQPVFPPTHSNPLVLLVLGLMSSLLVACSDEPPPADERYRASDSLFEKVSANVSAVPDWRVVTEIDHSRLGVEAGSSMPPARVLIFSDPKLETELIGLQPLAALELPLRVLAYEQTPGGTSKVTYNRFAYLQSRYDLPAESGLAQRYEQRMGLALQGIAASDIADFARNDMEEKGIISIPSPYDFDETLARIDAAIESQDDTVFFGRVDFRAQAAELGVTLQPSTMILFGAPAPGAKAMQNAPTLGLDGFCQKFLVWQDADGNVFLSFNDLLELARRQQIDIPIPLRIVNFRLNSVFRDALEG